MFDKKTGSPIKRLAGSVARGAIMASLVLSVTSVPALAANDASVAIPPVPPAESTVPPVEGTIQADAPVEFDASTAKITGEYFDDWYESITTVTVELVNVTGATYSNEIANIIERDGCVNTLAQTSTGEDAQDIFGADGTYTVTVSSDTFKDFTFAIDVATPPVKYDDQAIQLVDPSGDITDYTKLITEVIINGEAYVNGNPLIIKEDGTIDTFAVQTDDEGHNAFVFYEDVNTVIVKAPGYRDLQLTVNAANAQAVYRLYNPYDFLRLYTTDQAEYDNLVSLGWNGEGFAWNAPKVSRMGEHVYRLYNQYNGEHLYTTDSDEYNRLGEIGWTQEGVAFDSASGGSESVAVRRYYNPYITGVGSTHHYTSSAEEQEQMVMNGWIDEGIAFYGIE